MSTSKVALVTGAIRGLGFEISRRGRGHACLAGNIA